MRFVLVLALAALTAIPAASAANTGKLFDNAELNALAMKAEHATPRDQCYLYARLVSAMTDLASQQMSAGDTPDASRSLKVIQEYTARIHAGMTSDSRKLKDAQIMMRHTAFRLEELMRDASLGDQSVFQSTVKQLNQVQAQMMLAVFRK